MSKLAAPHNAEAEAGVIGSILIENAALVEVATLLEAGDFHDARHRLIFEAAKKLQSRQTPVDLVTLSSALRDARQIDDAGGAGYLAELLIAVPTAAHAGHYARLVREKAVARRLIEACREIATAAAVGDQNADTLLAGAMARLEAVGTGAVGADRDLLTLPELMDRYQHHVRNLAEERIGTGFPEMDGPIRGGAAPGEVLMISGPSGAFKSAFLQNILLNACHKTKRHVLFFSLEMPSVRVLERTVQIALEEYTYRVESGFKSHEGYREHAFDELSKLHADKLIVCDRPGLTIEKVEHYTRLARARFGQIAAVAIDYLGLMGADGAKSEYERISYVAENSKHLAKRLNVPVIILTQISRAAALSGDVGMHSAKGSGAIEASADYFLALMRNDRKELVLRLCKNRNGESDIDFIVDLDKKYLKFRGLQPADSIARKEVKRSTGRVRGEFLKEPVEYDPYP